VVKKLIIMVLVVALIMPTVTVFASGVSSYEQSELEEYSTELDYEALIDMMNELLDSVSAEAYLEWFEYLKHLEYLECLEHFEITEIWLFIIFEIVDTDINISICLVKPYF